jgi:hypothetical protein
MPLINERQPPYYKQNQASLPFIIDRQCKRKDGMSGVLMIYHLDKVLYVDTIFRGQWNFSVSQQPIAILTIE